MPRFTPFRAVRYATDTPYAEVIAPPYDVLSPTQVEHFHQQHPHNITHLDVPDGTEAGRDEDRYDHAARLYRQWRDQGVLVADIAPTLTIYRLRFTDAGAQRTISGVLGGLEVVDEGAGGVLPHERTTPKASTDRLDLTRATAANLSPVWGLSLARGLTDLLAEPAEPIAAVTDDADGITVEHIIERITDPDRIAAITALIGTDDVLIADGHHRYGVARTYRDEIREATGRQDGAAEQTLTFVNELVADQLSVAAIHRLYDDIDLDVLRSALGACFALSALESDDPNAAPTATLLAEMEAGDFLTLVTPDGYWALRPKPGAFDDERALDGAWLEAALAELPAGDRPTVSYQHGVEEVVDAVASGRAVAGVLIRPVGVAEIERTAREGLLMPPKSTFFTPKLKTGFVVRDLT